MVVHTIVLLRCVKRSSIVVRLAMWAGLWVQPVRVGNDMQSFCWVGLMWRSEKP